MEIWEPIPPGTLWATPGLLRDCFILSFIYLQPVPKTLNTPTLKIIFEGKKLNGTAVRYRVSQEVKFLYKTKQRLNNTLNERRLENTAQWQ